MADPRSGWLSAVLSRTVVRHIAGDQRAMEQLLTASPLDWTVLRPARLDDGVRTGRYAASAASTDVLRSGAVMSRGDLASMMLDTAERGTYINEVVWARGARP